MAWSSLFLNWRQSSSPITTLRIWWDSEACALKFVDSFFSLEWPGFTCIHYNSHLPLVSRIVNSKMECILWSFSSLLRNPVVHKPGYRHYVINLLPNLRVLDFKRIRMKVTAAFVAWCCKNVSSIKINVARVGFCPQIRWLYILLYQWGIY